MGKGKLEKFADMRNYPHVFEYPFSVADNVPFEMKGKWNEMFFHNSNPIVLELGCGRGEYTTGLARMYPDKNFIGVDIKGARMWTGATEALKDGLKNVAFLRTNIEIIERFFYGTAERKRLFFGRTRGPERPALHSIRTVPRQRRRVRRRDRKDEPLIVAGQRLADC